MAASPPSDAEVYRAHAVELVRYATVRKQLARARTTLRRVLDAD